MNTESVTVTFQMSPDLVADWKPYARELEVLRASMESAKYSDGNPEHVRIAGELAGKIFDREDDLAPLYSRLIEEARAAARKQTISIPDTPPHTFSRELTIGIGVVTWDRHEL